MTACTKDSQKLQFGVTNILYYFRDLADIDILRRFLRFCRKCLNMIIFDQNA